MLGGLIGRLGLLLGDPSDPKGPERFFQAIAGFVGDWWEISYRRKQAPLTVAQYAEAIVRLAQEFSGEGHYQLAEDQVTFLCTKCPFGEVVKEQPGLCHITSGIVGWTAARNFGYGKVVLRKRIAIGHEHCDIRVYVKKTAAAEAEEGVEYPSSTDLFPDRFGDTEGSLGATAQQLRARIRYLQGRVVELEEALEERRLIEKAKGILMERLNLSEAEAMRRLQRESQNRNKKLAELAQIIVQAHEVI